MKARPTQSRKGVKGQLPLAGSRDSVPCGVWGNAPTVPRATSMPNALNKGAGSEASLKEETGFAVTAEKNIAVQDWRKHNVMNYAYGVIKIFVMCKYESGKFEDNIETTQIAFFDKDSLPEKLAVEKCTKEQVLMCFKSYENHELLSYFD